MAQILVTLKKTDAICKSSNWRPIARYQKRERPPLAILISRRLKRKIFGDGFKNIRGQHK